MTTVESHALLGSARWSPRMSLHRDTYFDDVSLTYPVAHANLKADMFMNRSKSQNLWHNMPTGVPLLHGVLQQR